MKRLHPVKLLHLCATPVVLLSVPLVATPVCCTCIYTLTVVHAGIGTLTDVWAVQDMCTFDQ